MTFLLTQLDAFLQEDHHQVEVEQAGEGDERGQGDEDQHPREEGVAVGRAQEDETAQKYEEKYEETVESVKQHQPQNDHQHQPPQHLVESKILSKSDRDIIEAGGQNKASLLNRY